MIRVVAKTISDLNSGVISPKISKKEYLEKMKALKGALWDKGDDLALKEMEKKRRGFGNEEPCRRHLSAPESYDLIVSLITVTELYSGKSVQTAKGRKVLEDILAGVEIRIPDLELAIKAGELRAKYQLSLADSYIACLAMDLGLPLSTFDLSDFGKIKELKIYS